VEGSYLRAPRNWWSLMAISVGAATTRTLTTSAQQLQQQQAPPSCNSLAVSRVVCAPPCRYALTRVRHCGSPHNSHLVTVDSVVSVVAIWAAYWDGGSAYHSLCRV